MTEIPIDQQLQHALAEIASMVDNYQESLMLAQGLERLMFLEEQYEQILQRVKRYKQWYALWCRVTGNEDDVHSALQHALGEAALIDVLLPLAEIRTGTRTYLTVILYLCELRLRLTEHCYRYSQESLDRLQDISTPQYEDVLARFESFLSDEIPEMRERLIR